jgi:hypothetical protein
VRRWRVQDGDIITSWLLQVVAFLAVVALVVHEVVAIGVAHVSVDETGRDAARVAAAAYADHRSLARTEEAVRAALGDRAAELAGLEVDDEELVLTLSRTARTLLVHRVGPIEDLATTSTTRRVRWRS